MKKTIFNSLLTLLFLVFIGQQASAQNVTATEAHKLSNDDLKEFLGQFDPPDGQFFSITISLDGDDRLMAQPTNKSQSMALLKVTDKDTFELVDTGGVSILFNREDDKIVSLTLTQSGRSFTAKKVEK